MMLCILDAGEAIYFAKDWLGHKNIQNTTIYSKFSTGTRDARAMTGNTHDDRATTKSFGPICFPLPSQQP